MRQNICKLAILASLLFASVSSGKTEIDWDKNIYDTEEMFRDIPDMIGIDDMRFYFRMTNWFITGIERGLYNDTTLRINSDCFGDQFVTKLNEFEYISVH